MGPSSGPGVSNPEEAVKELKGYKLVGTSAYVSINSAKRVARLREIFSWVSPRFNMTETGSAKSVRTSNAAKQTSNIKS